jgi:hypothetical protein
MSLPPLHDEEMRQVDEYLADENAIDEAEQARLIEYLAEQERSEHIAPVPDAVSALAQNLKLHAVPEEDEEEEDNHSCGDSECVGEHVHADYADYADDADDYECGHRSPVTYEFDMYGCYTS